MPNLERFSVATFNLYNLQLPGARMHVGGKPWTQTQYEAKVAWTSRMLAELDADIVGLQELWDAEALRAVLARDGLDETYDLLAEPADGSRIACAAVVRKGLLRGESTWISDFPPGVRLTSSSPDDHQAPDIEVRLNGFSRPVLTFEVALQGPPTGTGFSPVHHPAHRRGDRSAGAHHGRDQGHRHPGARPRRSQ